MAGAGRAFHEGKGRVKPLPALLSRPLIRFIYTRIFNYQTVALKLQVILAGSALEDQPEALPAQSPVS